MPKKSTATSVLEKASNLTRIPILIHKLKNPPPNCLNLVLYIKSRKIRKNFRLLRHYNYEFVREYEFSASSTPLISPENTRKRKGRDLCSILFVCSCLGVGREEPQSYSSYPIEGLARFDELEVATMLSRKEEEEVETMSDLGDEEGVLCSSVDERAEKFIQTFYQQMKMQRLES